VVNQAVIGFACLVLHRPASWSDANDTQHLPQIVDLQVQEAQRGQGYGSAFVRAIERLAATAGYAHLYLSVDPLANPRAYALYHRSDPNEQPFAEAFLTGYTAVRPLAEPEYGLLPLFESVRAILEIGTPALHVNLWGSAYLESFFDQSLERLKRSMQQLAES
jgi:hypothetical protein